MIVYIPKNYGFCSGVSNAVKLAENLPAHSYCLGKLVHNAKVIDKLEKHGVIFVEDISLVPDGATMLIRAHGVGESVYNEAQRRGIKIVDATCPSVKKIQQKAREYYLNGYQIVIAGNADHPEVKGINGWCDNSAIITDGTAPITVKNAEKVLILFQTTFNASFFEKTLQNILTDGVKTLEIFNTICYTTVERQDYIRKIAPKCDFAVVVGDKNSSNTVKLLQIAENYCKAVLTDGMDGCKIDFSKNKKICLIAGASTPKELMKGVLERMVIDAKETVSVETVDESVMDKNGEMFAKAVSSMKDGGYRVGQRVNCRVVAKTQEGVMVRLSSWKQEVLIPNEELALENCEEFKNSLKEGDTLSCSVISTGPIVLSKKVIDERYKDDELVGGIKEGNEFSCVMKRVSKDCITGKLGSYTVVVHASQIRIGFVKDLEQYVGKTLRLVSSAEKVDDAKHVIFASQKAILLAEKKAKEDEFWNNIEVDEIVEGKVLRFAPFGAFVDVRGFDCLAHSSDLAWERVGKPEEVLEIGKTYEFVVLALDREKNRVSLGYKQLQPQPWEVAAEKFPVGAVVKGKVARILPYGAFIELDKHIDGLLHVSNVSWEWLDDINKALTIGEEIEVQVMEFDAEQKRITLSRKALLPQPQATAKEEPAEEQPTEETAE